MPLSRKAHRPIISMFFSPCKKVIHLQACCSRTLFSKLSKPILKFCLFSSHCSETILFIFDQIPKGKAHPLIMSTQMFTQIRNDDDCWRSVVVKQNKGQSLIQNTRRRLEVCCCYRSCKFRDYVVEFAFFLVELFLQFESARFELHVRLVLGIVWFPFVAILVVGHPSAKTTKERYQWQVGF